MRVHIYTEELGLVTAVATSAREERSKLRAHLVDGARAVYSLVKGKRDWRVTGAVGAQISYFECATDEQRLSAARVVALVKQFVHGEGADEGLFESVWEFLTAVPTLANTDVLIAEYVAVLRILAALGYVAKTDDVEAFIGPTYSAALIAHATLKRKDLVQRINDGIGASGLG
jgi:recombinational DNA repair protein (RecF pathway)